MCAYVRACVRSLCVRAGVCEYACACVCVCVFVRERACMCVCAYVRACVRSLVRSCWRV